MLGGNEEDDVEGAIEEDDDVIVEVEVDRAGRGGCKGRIAHVHCDSVKICHFIIVKFVIISLLV